jgi:hypothetical protein
MLNTHTFGIIEFSSPVLFAKDSLGQAVEISIASNIATLILPSLPEWTEGEADPLHKPLVPPPAAKTWKRDKHPIFWGHPMSYPSGEAQVERALLEFNIPAEGAEEAYQEIYRGFRGWLNLFEQYVVLLTTQNTRRAIEGGDGPSLLELLDVSKGRPTHISRKRSESITINLSGLDESLHLEQLSEACRLASLQLAPRLEYAMLLESYYARRSADYRKAIIEAATALEICLTGRILEEFETQGISFGEKLLKKFRMLSGRFELIRLLDISLPDKNYDDLILNPRNDVIHRAIFPDKRIANQVISEVEELLRAFSPTLNQEA